jgi:RHS repeat-associated protein
MVARDRNADGNATTGTGGLEQRVYALQDANWNTTAIIAASGVPGVAAGAVINRFAYTPYGEVQALTASWATPPAGSTPAVPWAHLFQGLEFTDVTGLAYVRHRDYSAILGRFIELDPIGFDAGDNNWYRFVLNSPTWYVDPSGLNLYAIDGTWTTYGSKSHVQRIYDRSAELSSYYWDGVWAGATGYGSTGIVKGVYNQVCADYCTAKNTGKATKINLIGWSRGAQAAVQVADWLNVYGCCCCTTWYGSCADLHRPVSVDFLGLFDAVNMTWSIGWTRTVPSNVRTFAHAIKSKHELIYPTIATLGGRVFWRHDGSPTTHADIGANIANNGAYDWMVKQARSAGVLLK